MRSYDSVKTGKQNAKIIDVEVATDIRFGRYLADVYKPVYNVDGGTVKDNGVFRYKKADGFLYDPKKNWGYARFLNVMGIKRDRGSDTPSFKPENIIGELVTIEVYEKVFTNAFSKVVKYPVARVVSILDIPF